jgi:hypothetical protein
VFQLNIPIFGINASARLPNSIPFFLLKVSIVCKLAKRRERYRDLNKFQKYEEEGKQLL